MDSDGIVKQTAKYISLDDKDDWEQDWDEITQLEPVETDNDKKIFWKQHQFLI